jgi:hypothetical protein
MRVRWLLAGLFTVLLAVFAVALWFTIVQPSAYEVRGEVIARAASNLLLVRHEAVAALGMRAMETMAIFADPAMLDAAALVPGDRVRLAVRREGDDLRLLRVEKLRHSPPAE